MLLGIFIDFFLVKIVIELSKNHCDLILTVGFDLSQKIDIYQYFTDIYQYLPIFTDILPIFYLYLLIFTDILSIFF